MSTVTVQFIIGGSVTEETWTAQRVSYQHHPDGRLNLRLYADGQVVKYVGYLRVERIVRTEAEA